MVFELIPFRKIGVGETFVIDTAPGNIYRRLDQRGNVEFLTHRSHPEYVGCTFSLPPSRAVRRGPMTQEEAELLGIEFGTQPFAPVPLPRNPAYDLLSTEDYESAAATYHDYPEENLLD